MDEREILTAQYNEALAKGDEKLAGVIGDKLLTLINKKIMEEDQYQVRTHGS